MRVLHLLNDVTCVGNGIVNVAVDLACTQAKKGHQVVVASAGGAFEDLLGNYGVTHVRVVQQGGLRTTFRALILIGRLIRRFHPDVVHVHMRTGVLLACAVKPIGSFRIIATVHNEFQRGAVLMGLADRVIAVSAAVRTKLIKRGIPARRLDTVRNGTLGSPRYTLFDPSGPKPTLLHPCVATVAGLFDRKGILDILSAFEILGGAHPNLHLYLIGDGPQRTKYEAVANKSSHHGRIHFEGFQPDVSVYLEQVDIFVLASHNEPFGLAVGEARKAGAAIIATDVDGIPEVLENGARGILVKPRDPQSLAAAVHRLLHDPEQLRHWRKQASENMEWLSVERMATQVLEVYLTALGCSPPSMSAE